MISLPLIHTGLSPSVKDWTVDDVCTYFKSTKDCVDFASIFKQQEVDGVTILQLTSDRMHRCLKLPLGKLVKVMAHVDKLKTLTTDISLPMYHTGFIHHPYLT